MSAQPPPYLYDPEPVVGWDGTVPGVTFAITTRHGLESHHAGTEHHAGPTCPCRPRIAPPHTPAASLGDVGRDLAPGHTPTDSDAGERL